MIDTHCYDKGGAFRKSWGQFGRWVWRWQEWAFGSAGSGGSGRGGLTSRRSYQQALLVLFRSTRRCLPTVPACDETIARNMSSLIPRQIMVFSSVAVQQLLGAVSETSSRDPATHPADCFPFFSILPHPTPGGLARGPLLDGYGNPLC